MHLWPIEKIEKQIYIVFLIVSLALCLHQQYGLLCMPLCLSPLGSRSMTNDHAYCPNVYINEPSAHIDGPWLFYSLSCSFVYVMSPFMSSTVSRESDEHLFRLGCHLPNQLTSACNCWWHTCTQYRNMAYNYSENVSVVMALIMSPTVAW